MPRLVAVRLPDDVAFAMEYEASRQERSNSQVIIRALREAWKLPAITKGRMLCDAPAGSSELAAQLSAARASKKEPIFPAAETKRKEKKSAKCEHGNDPADCIYFGCRDKAEKA